MYLTRKQSISLDELTTPIITFKFDYGFVKLFKYNKRFLRLRMKPKSCLSCEPTWLAILFSLTKQAKKITKDGGEAKIFYVLHHHFYVPWETYRGRVDCDSSRFFSFISCRDEFGVLDMLPDVHTDLL